LLPDVHELHTSGLPNPLGDGLECRRETRRGHLPTARRPELNVLEIRTFPEIPTGNATFGLEVTDQITSRAKRGQYWRGRVDGNLGSPNTHPPLLTRISYSFGSMVPSSRACRLRTSRAAGISRARPWVG